MDKRNITSHQLFTFSSLAMIGGSILVISSTLATVVKQDAWMSVLLTIAFGLTMMWVYCFLITRFSGLTFIGVIKKILGKWVGGAVSIAYVFFFFTMAYGIPWWIGTFGAHVMHETPLPVILLPYVAALVIGVYYGIEAVVRASEILYVIITTLLISMFLLVLPNVKLNYILPMYENGIIPILKGAFLLAPFIVYPAVALLMIFPKNCDDIAGGKKALMKGFLWCGIVTFITLIISLLVLGTPIVAKASFPTILLAREIRIGIVLTRLEYIISTLWTITEYMIGIMFFYVFIRSLSELLGLKDHKKIVLPVGLIVLVYSWAVYPSSIEEMNWIFVGFVPNSTIFGFVLPVIMLLVYLIRGPRKKAG